MDLWLGKEVKDTLTGYIGKVTAVALYITSETRLLVEGIDTTGRPIEWWIDEKRVAVI